MKDEGRWKEKGIKTQTIPMTVLQFDLTNFKVRRSSLVSVIEEALTPSHSTSNQFAMRCSSFLYAGLQWLSRVWQSRCPFTDVIRKYFLSASIRPTSTFYFAAQTENEKKRKMSEEGDQENQKGVVVMVVREGVGVEGSECNGYSR
jgi:hypothetical protein